MNEIDKLKEALNCADHDIQPPVETMGWFPPILAAARAHLAELEAKKPKRATLKQLQFACIAAARSLGASFEDTQLCLNQAADILRALDEKVVPQMKWLRALREEP